MTPTTAFGCYVKYDLMTKPRNHEVKRRVDTAVSILASTAITFFRTLAQTLISPHIEGSKEEESLQRLLLVTESIRTVSTNTTVICLDDGSSRSILSGVPHATTFCSFPVISAICLRRDLI